MKAYFPWVFFIEELCRLIPQNIQITCVANFTGVCDVIRPYVYYPCKKKKKKNLYIIQPISTSGKNMQSFLTKGKRKATLIYEHNYARK